jgi:transcription elongation factor GreA
MAIKFYTEEGLKNIKNELQRLKNQERQKIANIIAEAREKGDLSENAEYDAAKDQQAILEYKIKELELEIGEARVLTSEQIDDSKVGILSKVTAFNYFLNKEVIYEIVSTHEIDILKNKISALSPIAKALMGKKVDDVIFVNVPAGEMKIKILKIEY